MCVQTSSDWLSTGSPGDSSEILTISLPAQLVWGLHACSEPGSIWWVSPPVAPLKDVGPGLTALKGKLKSYDTDLHLI